MHQAKHKPMLNTNDLEATYKTNLMLININQNKQLKPSELIPPCHMPFVLKTQLNHEKQTPRTRPRVKVGEIIQNRT